MGRDDTLMSAASYITRRHYGNMISYFLDAQKDFVTINAYLIEDNPLIRENLAATLQELANVQTLGYAETEADGVRQLRQSDQWQLAIVDIFLKQGSGLKVLASCADRSPGKKVVVLSNYATSDVRKQCMALGADAVFDKSTDIDALIAFCLAMPAAGSDEDRRASPA
jgi:two-component system, OmpR family, response regulator